MKTLFNRIAALITAVLLSANCFAQIGYQVALLNSATGEPRANETVSCDIRIDNKNDEVIYKGTQTATTNDLGILSLTVGNADMFKNVDWSTLPFFVSVSVDGQLIGRTQILNVPVAEHAKHYGELTYENIKEKNIVGYSSYTNNDLDHCILKWIFNDNNSVSVIVEEKEGDDYSTETYSGTYYIDGNMVSGQINYKKVYNNFLGIRTDYGVFPFVGHYAPESNTIFIVAEANW